MKRPIKIILYGPPGAGKETQVRALSDKLGVPGFSIGDLVTKEIEQGTTLGQKLQPFVMAGDRLPETLVVEVLLRRIFSGKAATQGYILNGYPRTHQQLEKYLVKDIPTLIVHLLLPDAEIEKRLVARGRSTDTYAVVQKKIKNYHESERAVYNLWKRDTEVPVIEVDALKPIGEVTSEIVKSLEIE